MDRDLHVNVDLVLITCTRRQGALLEKTMWSIAPTPTLAALCRSTSYVHVDQHHPMLPVVRVYGYMYSYGVLVLFCRMSIRCACARTRVSWIFSRIKPAVESCTTGKHPEHDVIY